MKSQSRRQSLPRTNREQRANHRALSRDERQLWDYVARDIHPLARRKPATQEDIQENRAEESQLSVLAHDQKTLPIQNLQKTLKQIHHEKLKSGFPAVVDKPLPLPPLVSLETKVLKALKKGRRDVEAKLDLHGLYQQEAFATLRSFLFRAHSQGKIIVLVVTGKGSALKGFAFSPQTEHSFSLEKKGVLRRMLPHWLTSPELRGIVLGYEEAAIRHGGEGAFYVRLRKNTLFQAP